ncbi:MAG: ribonuclease E activity regulator RraA [Sandaracinaceae bacterium]|nr:ribonuclease E activity regulator RraA [Sandaracinaceae bacterium]
MSFSTADLFDAHEDRVQVAEAQLLALGRRRAFSGPIRTVQVHEDNALVRRALEEPGGGAVLVVDGGGSLRAALVGDKLAGLAVDNGWAGLVVWGCVRDRVAIDALDIGVRCLGTTPRRSAKNGFGQRDVPVTFAGVRFAPGAHVYCDEDGVLVSPAPLA